MIIDFEFESKYGTFKDALHLPDDHVYSEQEIEAMKQQRFDNWIDFVTAIPSQPDPSIISPAPENPPVAEVLLPPHQIQE